MSLPLDILHRTPEEAARRIALSFLDEARAACDRLLDPSDEEALHDFRVAVRRMRSTLRAWKRELKGTLGKKHAQALRALQQATGGGRDAEVAIEWLEGQRADLRPAHRRGHQWLVDRLTRRLGASMDTVREDVRAAFDKVEGDVRRRMERMTIEVHLDGSTPGRRFGDALAAKAREHVQDVALHLTGIRDIDEEEEAHEARIRCKRLRYLVEPVVSHVKEAREVVKQCKRLQDVLGDLNDSRVLRDDTGRALEEAAAEHARQLYELMREDDTASFRRVMRRSERSGLLEVARRLQRRQGKLFTRLTRDWIEDGAARLIAGVEAVARRIEVLVSSSEEIERKYLLSSAPALPEGAVVLEIEQGYLPTKQMEERVRRTREGESTRTVRTFKLGAGLRRLEFDEAVPAAVFEALWPLTEGRRVRKRRHVVKLDGATWEIDEFLDRDLWLAEIELADAETPVEFPEWLAPVIAREVTEQGDFANRKLAL